MSRNALIIIDMLNDFIDPEGALYCGKEGRAIIDFIRERLKIYREREDTVIYLRDAHDENDSDSKNFPNTASPAHGEAK